MNALGRIGFYDSGADKNLCKFTDRQHDGAGSSQGLDRAKADCTESVETKWEAPLINRYTEPLAWIRGEPGQPGFYVTWRHWCALSEVVVAVKKAAYESPTFQGIGFYAYDHFINADESNRRRFFRKDEGKLVQIGSAQLKDGESSEVLLFKFLAAGPCEVNGSGNMPRHEFKFKPYVAYEGGYERWENVSSDHGFKIDQSWDRSADLLQ